MRLAKYNLVFLYVVLLYMIVCLGAGVASATDLIESKTRIANSDLKLDKQEKKQARKELKRLKKLSRRALIAEAETGSSLAGLAVAQHFSTESTLLATTPVLANSAAEDAIRWYNLAAQIGALQSRPITEVSVRPLRASRTRRR